MSREARHFYEFGPFRLDSDDQILLRDGLPVDVTPQALCLLAALIEKAGRVVTKEELNQRLWPQIKVSDNSLPQAVAALRRALNTGPDLEEYIETITRRGYRLRVEVREVLDHGLTPLIGESSGLESPKERSTSFGAIGTERRRMMFAISLFLIGATCLLYFLLGRRNRAVQAPSQPGPSVPSSARFAPRRSVAVLGFRNASGHSQDEWLSIALSEMLTTELASGKKIRVVPQEDAARTKADLSLTDGEMLGKDALTHLRANLGGDLFVDGSYTVVGQGPRGHIRLDLRVRDSNSGENEVSIAQTGDLSALFDLVSQTGARLRDKLGLGEISSAEAESVRASLPSNPIAAKLYSEGLQSLRAFDALGARDFFDQSVAADQMFPLAHARLADAWSALGYDETASNEAKKAFDLSGLLSQEQRLWVEAGYREMTKEWNLAVEVDRRLWNFYPDEIDYGLRLTAAQVSAGKNGEAFDTIAAMRQLPSLLSDDPRIDLAEARAAEEVSDYKRELATAEDAVSKADRRGARLLAAAGRLRTCIALENLGDFGRAGAECETARSVYKATGDRTGAARALNGVANVLSDKGDLRGAKKAYEESLSTFREVGNKAGVAVAFNNIALVLKQQGDFEGSKNMYGSALTVDREINNKKGVARELGNLANILKDRGNLTGAGKLYEQSLAMRRVLGDQNGISLCFNNIAIIRWYSGNLVGAREAFEQSLEIRRQIGEKDSVAQSLSNLGGLLYELGDLPGARVNEEEALAVYQQLDNKSGQDFALSELGTLLFEMGNSGGARQDFEIALAMQKAAGEAQKAAETMLSLSELSIVEGRPQEADASARAAVEQFGKEGEFDDEATGYALLARALAEQGKPSEALAAADHALTLSKRSQAQDLRLQIAITVDRVRGLVGSVRERDHAIEGLHDALRDSRRMRNQASEFDARLALGEIELKSGRAEARTHLASLVQDAKARDFGLIAQEAKKALQ